MPCSGVLVQGDPGAGASHACSASPWELCVGHPRGLCGRDCDYVWDRVVPELVPICADRESDPNMVRPAHLFLCCALPAQAELQPGTFASPLSTCLAQESAAAAGFTLCGSFDPVPRSAEADLPRRWRDSWLPFAVILA